MERSQQPHDLINGDKHKPALTSAALRSNKDAAQVQPNKVFLQGVCVCMCARTRVCVLSLSFLCFELFQTDPVVVLF